MRNEQGFSIISLVVAIALLIFGLLAVMTVSAESLRVLAEARMHQKATVVAESYMEDAIERGVTDSEPDSVMGRYTRSLAVTPNADTTLYRLTVDVDYISPRGRNRTVRLVTQRRAS